MRVIGIDPGYDRVGMAIVEYQNGSEKLIHSTCLETDRTDHLHDRLNSVGTTFLQLLKEYRPDTLAIETLFFNKNQKTAIGVAQARGAIIFLATQQNCLVYEFGPQEVKVAITGYGKSDKTAVTSMLKQLIVDVPEDALDDEYDAIALGITCLAHHGRGR